MSLVAPHAGGRGGYYSSKPHLEYRQNYIDKSGAVVIACYTLCASL